MKFVSRLWSNKSEIENFNLFIEEMDLFDIHMIGRRYTWYRPNRSAKSKIDRCLITQEWLQIWKDSKQYALDRSVSNNCALILTSKFLDWGPRPFRTFYKSILLSTLPFMLCKHTVAYFAIWTLKVSPNYLQACFFLLRRT